LFHPAKQADRTRWYAVHTRSNFEKRVAGELAPRGVETFLPLVRELHQWKDRRQQVELPVFPGYVFVRLADRAEDRLRVLRTGGAVRILGGGNEIEPVPDVEIESIRRLVGSERAFCLHPFLKQGVRVRVRRGPLRGVEGLMEQLKSGGRLVMAVEMLSRAVATEVDARDVDVIGAAVPRV
jgi:transcription antitermination factor NusG